MTTWIPVLQRIEIIKHDPTLETKLIDGETGTEFTILNVYGLFYNRKYFWEKIRHTGAMEKEKLILGGDLNLTLTMGEVCGENSRKDALGNFFLDFFEKRKLVDVVPLKLEPT